MRQLHVILTVSALILHLDTRATAPAVTYPTTSELASAALRLAPRLSYDHAFTIAAGARVAAKAYHIDPYLLIAIAFQESSFRQNLPTGPAGELGICQVLSSWASNPAFKREFGVMGERDFRDPLKSFLFAAWLLSTVRSERGINGALPSWTFYNGYAPSARHRYYTRIRKHLDQMRNVGGSL